MYERYAGNEKNIMQLSRIGNRLQVCPVGTRVQAICPLILCVSCLCCRRFVALNGFFVNLCQKNLQISNYCSNFAPEEPKSHVCRCGAPKKVQIY